MVSKTEIIREIVKKYAKDWVEADEEIIYAIEAKIAKKIEEKTGLKDIEFCCEVVVSNQYFCAPAYPREYRYLQ